MVETADVVIIGGGIIGCSIAYHVLRRDSDVRVVILEREIMPGMGSTARATGGIRHQFSSVPNIRVTQLSLAMYRRFEEEIGYSVAFRPHGYLFVTADPATLERFRQNVSLQQVLGVPSEILSPEEIAALVPGIEYRDLVGGAFCREDGSAEPAAALQGYAVRARSPGARILCEQEVVDIMTIHGATSGV